MDKEEIILLLEEYTKGDLGPEGQFALQDWIRNVDEGDLRVVMEAFEHTVLGLENYPEPNAALLQKIQTRIKGLRAVEGEKDKQEYRDPAPVRQLPQRRSWFAAAVFILLLGTCAWYFLLYNPQRRQPVLPSHELAATSDVSPGSNKAILILGNGKQIILDSAQNGLLTRQGSVRITKLKDGQIAYVPSTSGEQPEEVYNIMTTPRGGQYKLTLPDGTNVWLNASSSIRYPTAFTGNERRVEITGEAYFEVAQNKAKPFHVSFLLPSGGQRADLQVLGTQFNINTYADEPIQKTTLLQGSVKIILPVSPGKDREVRLVPGQQALLEKGATDIRVIDNADTNAAIAWKEGYFNFNKLDIKTIMRQLSRWYDVDISYEGEIKNQTFYGGIQRNLALSKVFRILEKSGIHFTIDGKKVIVTP